MFSFQRGIYFDKLDLWADSQRPVRKAIISHAHLDHACKPELLYATKSTIELLKQRIGLSKTREKSLEFGEVYQFEGGALSLYPAGHILGSAQALVEIDGVRILYSGDFNMAKSLTAEAIEIPECDILIMESTFGHPDYEWPPRNLVVEQLLDFVEKSLKEGSVPIIGGYTLGKSQEALKLISDASFPVQAHGSIAVLAKIYERFGVKFGAWERYKKSDVGGKALLIPPKSIETRMVRQIPNKKTLFLSGWSAVGNKGRRGFEQALPLSDHADFNGLLEYARLSGAKQIYTLHGFKSFPERLRNFGFSASLIEEKDQLSLF